MNCDVCRIILTLLIILYLLKLSNKSFKLENVSLKMSNFDSLVVLDIFMLCMLLPSNKQLLLSRLLFRSYRMDDTLVDTGRRQHLHLQTIQIVQTSLYRIFSLFSCFLLTMTQFFKIIIFIILFYINFHFKPYYYACK